MLRRISAPRPSIRPLLHHRLPQATPYDMLPCRSHRATRSILKLNIREVDWAWRSLSCCLVRHVIDSFSASGDATKVSEHTKQ